jgi:hypothetical protein
VLAISVRGAIEASLEMNVFNLRRWMDITMSAHRSLPDFVRRVPELFNANARVERTDLDKSLRRHRFIFFFLSLFFILIKVRKEQKRKVYAVGVLSIVYQ